MEEKLKTALENVIQKIYDSKGEVLASELLEAASDKSEPAHKAFEWDNKKAGHQYRLWQARRYLRIILVRTESGSPKQRLIHVPRSASEDEEIREGSYKAIAMVAANIDEFQRALSEAKKYLSAAQRAVNDLQQAAREADKPEYSALISELSRGLDIFESAILSLH